MTIFDHSHFDKWSNRIKRLPGFFIDDVCRDAVDLWISGTDARAASDFINQRRDKISSIIKANRRESSGIRQWRLLQ